MTNYPAITKIYTHVWSKYRPAILQLMIASVNGPQQYKFSDHEFRRVNPKEKGGYSFTMQVFQGKSINSIKTSATAQDLIEILQQSKKATELLGESTYEFLFDKRFVLHVTKIEKTAEVVTETVSEVTA